MSLVVEQHHHYLADEARVSAFARAIAEVVKPGDVVLDLGAGTGILGMLACRAGAARVYAIEKEAVIELGRAVCQANGFADRVVFLKEHSTRAFLPEEADVLVTDQIGGFGFDVSLLRYLHDARARLLKPGGILIPSSVDLYVAPAECSELRDRIEFWSRTPAGFDFGPAREIATNTAHLVPLGAENLLGEPAAVASLNLSAATAAPLKFEVCSLVTRSGVLDGVAGWFSARLSPGVTMTNSPGTAGAIQRYPAVFPVDPSIAVEPGDCVQIDMRILPADLVVAWTVEVRPHAGGGTTAGKGRSTRSTLEGMLIAREDLRRTEPGFVPRLSRWGEARLSVLTMCDGRTPVGDLEREIHRKHADLFPSLGDAAAFVAEVVTRYSM